MSSTAGTTQSTRHGRIIQILIHFTAVLFILICLGLLESEIQPTLGKVNQIYNLNLLVRNIL